ncbi:MAG: hypothetical protein KTR31_29940 [Myxococcales bacterium]|nr:hypothetical protein [Myxococcales bacterium]
MNAVGCEAVVDPDRCEGTITVCDVEVLFGDKGPNKPDELLGTWTATNLDPETGVRPVEVSSYEDPGGFPVFFECDPLPTGGSGEFRLVLERDVGSACFMPVPYRVTFREEPTPGELPSCDGSEAAGFVEVAEQSNTDCDDLEENTFSEFLCGLLKREHERLCTVQVHNGSDRIVHYETTGLDEDVTATGGGQGTLGDLLTTSFNLELACALGLSVEAEATVTVRDDDQVPLCSTTIPYAGTVDK